MKSTTVNKYLGTTLVAGALALTGVAEAATLKISHIRPQNSSVNTELKEFAANVKEATEGDVKIRIYAANALGDYTTVQERISLGAIDMAVQPAATAASREMQVTYFPYMAENWQQAEKIYGPGGVVYDTMKNLYAKQDITMLAAYPVYFSGIALNRDAVTPGDTSSKGIKVRVPAIKSFQLTSDQLGYISSPIPFSEAFTAVQTGVVDGVIGAGAEGYYASFRDVTKTYVPANITFEAWYLIINTETFEDLDEEDQVALQAQAKKFETQRWARAQAEQGEYEQKLVDYGAKLEPLTDEQLAVLAKDVRENVWPEILADFDAKWGQNIMQQLKK